MKGVHLPLIFAAWFAATVAASGSAPQAVPDGHVTLVLDAPSPVFANDAAQLTSTLIGQLQAGRVRYFSLATERPDEIPPGALDEFVARAVDVKTQQPGIRVTPQEAIGIVGKNEQIRDEVIRRECQGQPEQSGCGPAVHVAAVQILNDLDTSTRNRLRALITIVAGTARGAWLVLVTAGLPCRAELKPLVNELTALITDRGVRLMVVRMPSTINYAGAIRDAAKDLTTKRSTVTLLQARTTTDLPTIAGRVLELQEASHAAATAPGRPGRMNPEDANLLLQAQRHAAEFANRMRFLVAREHYDQQVKARPANLVARGQTFGRLVQQRVMDSEVTLAQVSDDVWFMVRRVQTWTARAYGHIGGKPRRSRDGS